ETPPIGATSRNRLRPGSLTEPRLDPGAIRITPPSATATAASASVEVEPHLVTRAPSSSSPVSEVRWGVHLSCRRASSGSACSTDTGSPGRTPSHLGHCATRRLEGGVLQRQEVGDGERLAGDEALAVTDADPLAVAAGGELDVLAEAVERHRH